MAASRHIACCKCRRAAVVAAAAAIATAAFAFPTSRLSSMPSASRADRPHVLELRHRACHDCGVGLAISAVQLRHRRQRVDEKVRRSVRLLARCAEQQQQAGDAHGRWLVLRQRPTAFLNPKTLPHAAGGEQRTTACPRAERAPRGT